jgi:hypothetical protein
MKKQIVKGLITIGGRLRSPSGKPLSKFAQKVAKFDEARSAKKTTRTPRKTAKKTPTKKTPTKKIPTKKIPTKKAPTKKAPTKKTPIKKVPAKKTPRKAPAKKTPTKKAAGKKFPTKTAVTTGAVGGLITAGGIEANKKKAPVSKIEIVKPEKPFDFGPKAAVKPKPKSKANVVPAPKPRTPKATKGIPVKKKKKLTPFQISRLRGDRRFRGK